MNIRATSLIYSSHNMCPHIHRDWIIERALENPYNKRLLYIPMSEAAMGNGDEYERQQFGYSKFEWYLDRFTQWGLHHDAFYYSSSMTRQDADTFLEMLTDWEVVIFGGGNPALGMRRFREIGARFYGDPDIVQNLTHDRQKRGQLTAGFSAGADQLAELMAESAYDGEVKGFGLSAKIACTLHHEWGREQTLIDGARRHPWCLWFGLPNDSGIATQQGSTAHGNFFQIAEFVVDQGWDLPSDGFHIKTRQGMGVEHYYADGRHWTFHGGHMLLRIDFPDGGVGAWIDNGHQILDYNTQQPTHYGSLGDILGTH